MGSSPLHLVPRRTLGASHYLTHIDYLRTSWLLVIMSAAMFQMTPAMLAALKQENRAPALIGIMTSGLLVSLITLSLRFWARAKIVRKVGVDDWTSLLSFVRCPEVPLRGNSCSIESD